MIPQCYDSQMDKLEWPKQNSLSPGVIWITVKEFLKSCPIIHIFQSITKSNDLILKMVDEK